MPVALNFEQEDGFFIISEDAFNIYGEGPSLEEAQKDFIDALVEYYEILKKYANDDPASRVALDDFSQIWLLPGAE